MQQENNMGQLPKNNSFRRIGKCFPYPCVLSNLTPFTARIGYQREGRIADYTYDHVNGIRLSEENLINAKLS